MKRLIFPKALLPTGWTDNVYVEIDPKGRIAKILTDHLDSNVPTVEGYALPGMNNIHSHAFQRAMAGLAEYSTSQSDSFWTWRDLMYRFADNISPTDLMAISSQLYVEMLKAGYVSVAEFHYLHRAGDENGHAMSHTIMSAASATGIALCHLPVLYMASGFGGQELSAAQKKFAHEIEDYLDLRSELSSRVSGNHNQQVGTAFHSLRAVPEDALREYLENEKKGPFHIHIAEQIQEVNDCVSWSEQRPVEWLYDHADVDENWCLIHATHLNDYEIETIAGSGAVVGVCPTTEANLGDGLFPLKSFLSKKGRIAIGSDSHISVSVAEELRLLEYGQRLESRKRNIAVDDTEIHTGTNLYLKSLKGGSQACGFDNGQIEIGKRADIIVLDKNSPILVGTPDTNIIDRFVFNGNVNPVKHVFVGGEHLVCDFKHIKEDEILHNFSRVAKRLKKCLD